MAANSIAPSRKTLDIYLDGADWKVALYEEDGTTQIASTTIGDVDVDASSIVLVAPGTPLDLRAMGGEAANEIRVHGAGTIQLRLSEPASAAFPVSSHPVVNGEVLTQQVEQIVSIGAGITRLRLAWG